MSLSILAMILGAAYCLVQVYALLQPKSFGEKARAFPRSEKAGFVLMAIGTLGFLYNLNAEAIADFAAYKKLMLACFGGLGFLACIFVRDYLAVRGLSICLLLLAWFTLNQTRWEQSSARLIVVVWAYSWVIAGMWFTVSPWRLRDFLHWLTANERRLRAGSVVQLAFGALIVLLGATVFRP